MKKLHAAKAAICAILVLSMLFCSGCAGKTKDLALYGTGPDGKVLSHMTPGMFSYFLSQQKSTYFTVLSFNDSSITSDSPEIWSRPAPDGGTYGEKFFEDVLNEAKTLVTANTMLYSLPSADEKKDHYELPEDYLDYVDSLIVQNAIDKYGSVMAFEDYLLNFGTTLEDYTNLYIMTANVDLLKEEYYIPNVVDEGISAGEFECKVIHTDAIWKGVTYRTDKPDFTAELNAKINAGVYPENLWA